MSTTTVFPPFPSTVRGCATTLKLSPNREQLIYGHSRTVVIRDIVPKPGCPIGVQLYSKHGAPVTAAAMAPSGCYVASGDEKGNVLIWACDNPDQITKLETIPFAGAVLDIAWSADNQRLVCVGDGKQSFGKVFMWDSGNTVGEISGHQKKLSTCDFKATRPFRIVTGGDDMTCNFFEGPPFKYKATAHKADRFVYTTRFSPDGSQFLVAAGDMTVSLFDGKDASPVIAKKVSQGSIYGADWSKDSSQIVIASADKTIKVLSAGTLDEVASYTFGKTPLEMQVGCAWASGGLLSYSLGGVLSLLDPVNLSSSIQTQVGHNKSIASICWASPDQLVSASYFSMDETSNTGCMRVWDPATGLAKPFSGAGHSSRVLKVAMLADGTVASIGGDDALMISTIGASGDKVALDACPVDMAAGASHIAVILTTDTVQLFNGKTASASLKLEDVKCVAVAPNDSLCVVGLGSGEISVLGLPGLAQTTKLALHRDAVSALAFSPGSERLASGCANKAIVIWDVQAGTPLVTGLEGFHAARITSLAWSPGGKLASSGVDASLIVWDLETKKPKLRMALLHAEPITAIAFKDDETLATASQDAHIKLLSVP